MIRASRRSAAAFASVLALAAVWTTVTVARGEGLVPGRWVAASPARIGHGQIWLLFTSGLLVQRPVALSLVSVVLLAMVAVAVCGPRQFWIAMIVGHVFSTLIAYGLLAAARLVDHGIFASLVHAPDYGVSAIAAAWLGSIAGTAWERRGSSPGGKAAIVVCCTAVAVFGWTAERHVQHHLTFLDSEHVFAFALGLLALLHRSTLHLAPMRATRVRKTQLADT